MIRKSVSCEASTSALVQNAKTFRAVWLDGNITWIVSGRELIRHEQRRPCVERQTTLWVR